MPFIVQSCVINSYLGHDGNLNASGGGLSFVALLFCALSQHHLES